MLLATLPEEFWMSKTKEVVQSDAAQVGGWSLRLDCCWGCKITQRSPMLRGLDQEN